MWEQLVEEQDQLSKKWLAALRLQDAVNLWKLAIKDWEMNESQRSGLGLAPLPPPPPPDGYTPTEPPSPAVPTAPNWGMTVGPPIQNKDGWYAFRMGITDVPKDGMEIEWAGEKFRFQRQQTPWGSALYWLLVKG